MSLIVVVDKESRMAVANYASGIDKTLTIRSLSGGSIRVPSAFNFLYGLRPSHGRMPYAKMANSMEGQETVHSVCGPITHSVPGTFSIIFLSFPKQ